MGWIILFVYIISLIICLTLFMPLCIAAGRYDEEMEKYMRKLHNESQNTIDNTVLRCYNDVVVKRNIS